MAGLQSGERRMMIDSVDWTQYINVTGAQTDSCDAMTNATPTQIAQQCEGGGSRKIQTPNKKI